METRYANYNDMENLLINDKHIVKEELETLIKLNRVIVAYNNNKFVGWLRYNLFWDNIPFMNMLYVIEEDRSNGIGSNLIKFWENEMKEKGYKMIMTSSQSNEQAQHLYRKLNYIDSGALLLPNEPLEIIFVKHII